MTRPPDKDGPGTRPTSVKTVATKAATTEAAATKAATPEEAAPHATPTEATITEATITEATITEAASQPSPRPRELHRQALRRKLAAAGLILSVCTAVVVTRAVWAGMRALANGDAALQQGHTADAVALWRRAAHWYVPGSSHVGVAYQRLEGLAREAEDRGDTRNALAAWRAIRGAIFATRSFYLPYESYLEPANRNIARLMAADAGASAASNDTPGEVEGEDASAREARHYRLLSRHPGPSTGWAAVALAGFAIWLGGGFLFTIRGITRDDKLVPSTAGYSGILVVMGLLMWMLGLYLA